MQPDPRIEEWANYLATQHWDSIDELAALIVAELNAEGE